MQSKNFQKMNSNFANSEQDLEQNLDQFNSTSCLKIQKIEFENLQNIKERREKTKSVPDYRKFKTKKNSIFFPEETKENLLLQTLLETEEMRKLELKKALEQRKLEIEQKKEELKNEQLEKERLLQELEESKGQDPSQQDTNTESISTFDSPMYLRLPKELFINLNNNVDVESMHSSPDAPRNYRTSPVNDISPISHRPIFRRKRKNTINREKLNSLPIVEYGLHKNKEFCEECVICMEEFKEDDKVKFLTCFHSYHPECIDKWLLSHMFCPICKESLL